MRDDLQGVNTPN